MNANGQCSAGDTAPTLSTSSDNLCDVSSVNLNNYVTSPTPPMATLEWSTLPNPDPFSPGNFLQDPNITISGIYYGFYYGEEIGIPGEFCRSPVAPLTISIGTTPTVDSANGDARCDPGQVTLTATASAGVLNWYAVPSGGTILDTGTSFTTTVAVTTTFYVEAIDNNCSSARTPVTATVTPLPTVDSTNGDARCGPGQVTLTATASAGVLNWYAVPSGGTILDTGTSFTTTVAVTTTFYVEAIDNNCNSVRTPVTAIVTPLPTVDSANGDARCGPGQVTLTATASAGVLNWYAVPSGGTILDTGTSFTTTVAVTTTFYVEAFANNCSSARTPVTATVTTLPTVDSTNGDALCGPGQVTLTATASAGVLNWYAVPSGGTILDTGTSFTTTVAVTTTFYVEAFANNCSSARTPVLATVTPLPTVDSTNGDARCGPGQVTLTATASAGVLNWYAVPSGGTILDTGTSFTTTVAVTTTFYVEAIDNNCNSVRTPVTAIVTPLPTVDSANGDARCGPGQVTLTATASAGVLNWYAVPSGGTILDTGTSFTTTVAVTTTFYVEAFANNCSSSPRTAVAATVTATPTINSTTPGERCGPGLVTLSAIASNGTINWYTAPTGGTLVGSGTSITPNVSVTTTFYVEATANSCVSGRTPVVATVSIEPSTGGAPDNIGDAACNVKNSSLPEKIKLDDYFDGTEDDGDWVQVGGPETVDT